MKLKKMISAFLALGIVATATSAFAADSDLFHIGTPYDITDGVSTDVLTEGHVIALPVDVFSTTDAITNFQYIIEYDSMYVTPGYDTSNATDDFFDTVATLGSETYASDDVTIQFINALGTWRGSRFTAAGSSVYNPAKGDNEVMYGWYHTSSQALNASTPEAYIIFTVNKSVDVDALNTEVFKASGCLLADTVNGKGDTPNVGNTVDKINACDGAFKIVVDSASLPYWVQGVDAVIDGTTYALDACVGADGTTEYSFPVRLTSAADKASVDVSIRATVSNDESGSINSRTVDWGTVNVAMDGTATTYVSSNANIAE